MRSPVETVGVLGSSGGSALIAAEACLRGAGLHKPLVVVTDRHCGMSEWAKDNATRCHVIAETDTHRFSREACRIFSEAGASRVLLFYTRRVEKELFQEIQVFNIHPSLLPDFPGLHALQRAHREGLKVLGATLHRVNDIIDGGRIINQVKTTISDSTTLEQAKRISYVQKVWLTIAWQQQIADHSFDLPPRVDELFREFVSSLGMADCVSAGRPR